MLETIVCTLKAWQRLLLERPTTPSIVVQDGRTLQSGNKASANSNTTVDS